MPAGYTSYADASIDVGLRPSRVVGKVVIGFAWAATAGFAALALAITIRKGRYDEFIADQSLATLDALASADDIVRACSILLIIAAIAQAIGVVLWTKRVADNAVRRGASNVRPKLAAAGWVIPFASIWVPWVQLRRSLTATGGSTKVVSRWQAVTIATGVLSQLVLRAGTDIDNATTLSELSDAAGRQQVFAVVMAIAGVLSVVVATRAIREVNRVVSRGR